jgi:hypothetical protein
MSKLRWGGVANFDNILIVKSISIYVAEYMK